jgi:hypothetical protein
VLLNLGINIIRYSVLYISSILPGRLIPGAEIFPGQEQLAAIREAYDDDWQRCAEYARTSSVRK